MNLIYIIFMLIFFALSLNNANNAIVFFNKNQKFKIGIKLMNKDYENRRFIGLK